MLSVQTWSYGVLEIPEYSDLLKKQTAYLTASPRIELASACSSMSFESLKIGASSLNTIRSITQVFGFAALIAICLPLLAICLPVLLLVSLRRRRSNNNDAQCVGKYDILETLPMNVNSNLLILIHICILIRSCNVCLLYLNNDQISKVHKKRKCRQDPVKDSVRDRMKCLKISENYRKVHFFIRPK